MKSRYLTPGEKRDVAVAAIEALKIQNPGCIIHVEVEDWTDPNGVPQYTATIKTTSSKKEPEGP